MRFRPPAVPKAQVILCAGILWFSVRAAGADGLAVQACIPESVGVDTSQADRDDYAAAIFGEGPGQTFFALDTLIRSSLING